LKFSQGFKKARENREKEKKKREARKKKMKEKIVRPKRTARDTMDEAGLLLNIETSEAAGGKRQRRSREMFEARRKAKWQRVKEKTKRTAARVQGKPLPPKPKRPAKPPQQEQKQPRHQDQEQQQKQQQQQTERPASAAKRVRAGADGPAPSKAANHQTVESSAPVAKETRQGQEDVEPTQLQRKKRGGAGTATDAGAGGSGSGSGSKAASSSVISSLFTKNPEAPNIALQKANPIAALPVFSSDLYDSVDALDKRIVACLRSRLNIIKMTRPQRLALPHLLSGQDVLLKSPTGTGKTLAYLIPMVQYLCSITPQVSLCVV
jgi:hypothetical protein